MTGETEPDVAERANLVRLIEASGGTPAQIAAAETLDARRLLAVEQLFLRSIPQYARE